MADRELHRLIGQDLPSYGPEIRSLLVLGPGDRIGPLSRGALRPRRNDRTIVATLFGMALVASAGTVALVAPWNHRQQTERGITAFPVPSPAPDFPDPYPVLPTKEVVTAPPPFEASTPAEAPGGRDAVAPPADAMQAIVPQKPEPSLDIPYDQAPPAPPVVERTEPKIPSTRTLRTAPHIQTKPPRHQAPVDVDATGSGRSNQWAMQGRRPAAPISKETVGAGAKEPSATWNLPSVLRPGGL